MYARNTLVQVLAAYTNPESHNAQRHRQTDRRTDRQTDNRPLPIADHTVYQYDRLKTVSGEIMSMGDMIGSHIFVPRLRVSAPV